MSKIKALLIILILVQSFYIFKPVSAATLTTKITPAMTSIPADGKPHPAFYISITDSGNKPSPQPFRVNVTLTSTDESSLTIPREVSISPASYYTLVNATSSINEIKTVVITASAANFQSSKASLSVGPPAGSPQSLMLTILPNVLLPLSPSQAELVISVVDSYGNPTQARESLAVSLSSSNLVVGDIDMKNLIIPRGSTNATATILTTGAQGSATITASVPNLKLGSATISVQGPKPAKIFLWAPSTVLRDETINPFFIGIVDSNNHPVKLVDPITVNLYSSDGTKFYTQNTVTIGTGEWNKIIQLNCAGLGSATITAIVENITSSSITVRSIAGSDNPVTGLKIYSMGSFVPTDGISHRALFLQVVDASGNPTLSNKLVSGSQLQTAPISLYSANSDIVDIADSQKLLYAQFGRSYIYVNVTTHLPGAAAITAVSQGLKTGSVNVNSYIAIPNKFSIQAPPIPVGTSTKGLLAATDGGIPAPAVQNTQVLLTSSNTNIGTSNSSTITISKNSYTAGVEVVATAPGQFSFTATSSGIPTSSIPIKIFATKPSKFSINYMKPVAGYIFPLILQLGSASSASAVTYQPITFTLSSSNMSSVRVPETITLNSDVTEMPIYCQALSSKEATITITSPGFTSITTKITPLASNLALKIVSGSTGVTGKTITLKAMLTLSDTPVPGVKVVWKGAGLTANNTLTDASGAATNTLLVNEGQNNVQALAYFGASSFLTVTKTITGVPGTYNLIVTSNVDTQISGSGTYSYGQTAQLTAPSSASMPGIIGLIGGKYVFQQWTGAISSTQNAITLPISGANPNISVNAVYGQDINMAIIVVAVILVIIIAAVVIFLRRRSAGKIPQKTLKKGSK